MTNGADGKKEVDCLQDCPDLGYCCRRFAILKAGVSPLDNRRTLKGVARWLRKRKLPFRPVEISPETGVWWVGCPLLGDDGRCTDYENRPKICVSFQPGGTDKLCLLAEETAETKEESHG